MSPARKHWNVNLMISKPIWHIREYHIYYIADLWNKKTVLIYSEDYFLGLLLLLSLGFIIHPAFLISKNFVRFSSQVIRYFFFSVSLFILTSCSPSVISFSILHKAIFSLLNIVHFWDWFVSFIVYIKPLIVYFKAVLLF